MLYRCILIFFLNELSDELLLCEEHTCIFKPPPPVGAGGGYMFSGRPSVRPSVRASVRDSRGSFMFPRYLQLLLTDFRQTFVTGASRNRDELIRFWGQKVKVQGHGMTECMPDFHLSTISPVSIDRFSPNFCHWCIFGHRWPDYVFGSKGQSSRSHHRGGGAQHSTLPSSATFSSSYSEALNKSGLDRLDYRRDLIWSQKLILRN